jgi:hypothetical protein
LLVGHYDGGCTCIHASSFGRYLGRAARRASTLASTDNATAHKTFDPVLSYNSSALDTQAVRRLLHRPVEAAASPLCSADVVGHAQTLCSPPINQDSAAQRPQRIDAPVLGTALAGCITAAAHGGWTRCAFSVPALSPPHIAGMPFSTIHLLVPAKFSFTFADAWAADHDTEGVGPPWHLLQSL